MTPMITTMVMMMAKMINRLKTVISGLNVQHTSPFQRHPILQYLLENVHQSGVRNFAPLSIDVPTCLSQNIAPQRERTLRSCRERKENVLWNFRDKTSNSTSPVGPFQEHRSLSPSCWILLHFVHEVTTCHGSEQF